LCQASLCKGGNWWSDFSIFFFFSCFHTLSLFCFVQVNYHLFVWIVIRAQLGPACLPLGLASIPPRILRGVFRHERPAGVPPDRFYGTSPLTAANFCGSWCGLWWTSFPKPSLTTPTLFSASFFCFASISIPLLTGLISPTQEMVPPNQRGLSRTSHSLYPPPRGQWVRLVPRPMGQAMGFPYRSSNLRLGAPPPPPPPVPPEPPL